MSKSFWGDYQSSRIRPIHMKRLALFKSQFVVAPLPHDKRLKEIEKKRYNRD